MPGTCEILPTTENLATGMIAFLDCQAQTIGAEGYRALATPSSTASVMLTGMVTLLIALIGYRMLLGHTPSIREGVLTFVKIGLVLMLATSWPAYQALVYDIVLHAPAEFASSIGTAADLPGGRGGLVARLNGVDQALSVLAIEGVGSPPPGLDGMMTMPAVAPPPFIGFDAFALGFARVIFLVGTILSFAVVRIGAGMLLALAPLFAGFLLFDGTRGLFEGWVKALIGTALASFAIAITLGVELAFLEPWLGHLLARRESNLDIIGAPAQLLAASTIFAIGLVALMLVVGRVAMSLRIPAWIQALIPVPSFGEMGRAEAPRPVTQTHVPIEGRSRAAAIADAVASNQRREDRAAETGSGSRAVMLSRSLAARGTADAYSTVAPVQNGGGRRTRSRISSRASARDRRS
ncbi:type IV secretion system protein VirB6 [Sphingomonas zeicaulis]|uniref:type IV secretion system protein n=1 Tax=Sphingomonas zeicaulis TaxID=1632740 RepID=UPI003D2462A7